MVAAQPATPRERLAAARRDLESLIPTTSVGAAESLKQTYADVWADTESALELIYAEFVTRRDAGQRQDREEWLSRYPQWRERLERLFTVGELFTPVQSDEVANVPADHPPGYTFLEIVGQGASAIVYKARQASLNRFVAVKVFHDTNAAARKRIAREGELAAHLQHPNIVPIYEVGEWHGQSFLTMEFIEGGPIDPAIIGSWSAPQVAELVEAIARAVDFAHQRGVVHRDLKPGNILWTGDSHAASKSSVKIVDFGLAIFCDSKKSVAESLSLAGTPCYMAPEQIDARPEWVGPRSDIYALGAVLYELLTGQPPLRGVSIIETLEMVRHAEPVPPRQVRPDLPRDLETICLKCLHKDPGRRYATAGDLADDLERFRTGRTIAARPVRAGERVWKWVRRNPTMAGLSLALFLALIGAVVAQSINYKNAESARLKEQKLNLELMQSHARQSIGAARALWNGGQLAALRETLSQCPPEFRDTNWQELNQLCNAHVACWTGPEYAAAKLAVSPDGARLALRRRAGSKTIDILDAANGTVQIEVPSTIPLQMEFSADGQSLLVLQPVGDTSSSTFTMTDVIQDNFARELVVWNLAAKSVTRRWPIPGKGGAMSRWGRRVASWNNNTISVWDTKDGKVVAELPQPTNRRLLPQLAISDDAKKLAVRLGSDDIRIWDIDAQRQASSFAAGPAIMLGTFQFHAAGQLLYGFAGELGTKPTEASNRPFIQAWNSATGTVEFQIPGRAPVVMIKSPDGKLLANLCDRAIELVDATTGVERATLLGHTDRIGCAAFSPDGNLLYTGAADNTLRTWDVRFWAK